MDTKRIEKMLDGGMPDELKALESPREAEDLKALESPREAEDPHATRGFNRKNWMRNKPCPCGSKKKFKKCCWNNYTK